jgi:integrase
MYPVIKDSWVARSRIDTKTVQASSRDRRLKVVRMAVAEWNLRPPAEGWLFANPAMGKPYYQEEIQKNHIRKAGIAAGIGSGIGRHTFRHTYRSWLDETGAPLV